MQADQFEMFFMRDVTLMSPAVIVQVLDDAKSYPIPPSATPLAIFPDKTRMLFQPATADKPACRVCNYPTEEADGLCSIACRRKANGHRAFVLPPMTRTTHFAIDGGNGGMKRKLTMDNQRIDFDTPSPN